jgi:hypothetical protein
VPSAAGDAADADSRREEGGQVRAQDEEIAGDMDVDIQDGGGPLGVRS